MHPEPNPIIEMLKTMPVWETAGISLSHSAEHIHFTRRQITLSIPSMEVLIFGAKKVLEMFRVLDQ
jgi:hypothetical protein